MRRTGHILIIAALLAGCREYSTPGFPDETVYTDMDIANLRSYYHERAVVSRDAVIAGRVISSDKAGNFYNTFFIDDGTGAVEIMAGMSDLHATYHPGQRVVVSIKGLAVGWNNGVIQVGLPPEPGNRYATGYFYHPAVIRKYISAERDIEAVLPMETAIGELNTDMCGRLVRIGGLTIDAASTAETWASTQPKPTTGYVKFRDSPADSITVMTSGYASFAMMPVPRETVAMTGILFYGKGGSSKDHYLLKLRDEKDIDY